MSYCAALLIRKYIDCEIYIRKTRRLSKRVTAARPPRPASRPASKQCRRAIRSGGIQQRKITAAQYQRNHILSHSIARQACRPCFIEGTGTLKSGKKESFGKPSVFSWFLLRPIEFLRKRKSEANFEAVLLAPFVFDRTSIEGHRARNQQFVRCASISLRVV